LFIGSKPPDRDTGVHHGEGLIETWVGRAAVNVGGVSVSKIARDTCADGLSSELEIFTTYSTRKFPRVVNRRRTARSEEASTSITFINTDSTSSSRCMSFPIRGIG
jgi:hypothetical protein